MERKSPRSTIEIDYEEFGLRIRFNKMFVALEPCIDGFINEHGPYLSIDSTDFTRRWKG
jgi:hypothetical protein